MLIGTLVHRVMEYALNACDVYKEGVVAVFCEQFRFSAIRLSKKVSSTDGILSSVSLMLARFAFLRFMSNPDLFLLTVFQPMKDHRRHDLNLSSMWI